MQPHELASAIASLIDAGHTTRAAQARELGMGESTLHRHLRAASLSARHLDHSMWIPWRVSEADMGTEYRYLCILSQVAQGVPTPHKGLLRSAFAWANEVIDSVEDITYTRGQGWMRIGADSETRGAWHLLALRDAAVLAMIGTADSNE